MGNRHQGPQARVAAVIVLAVGAVAAGGYAPVVGAGHDEPDHGHVVWASGRVCGSAPLGTCIFSQRIELTAVDGPPSPPQGAVVGVPLLGHPLNADVVVLTSLNVVHYSPHIHSFEASGDGGSWSGWDHPEFSQFEGCGAGACINGGAVLVQDLHTDADPPTAARNLSANAPALPPGWERIELWWIKASSYTGPVLYYNVYRGTDPGELGFYTTTALPNTASNCLHCMVPSVGNTDKYNDYQVAPGVTYYYSVAAVNVLGEGPRSEIANATVPAPEG